MFISYPVDEEIKLTYPIEVNAEELASVVSSCNEDLSRWVQWATPGFGPEEALAYIQFLNEKFTQQEKFWVFVRLKGLIVGGIGLNRFDFENQITELGYWLSADARGKGIATKAGAAMIRYAFEDLGYNRMELKTSPDNEASVAVAERLGFKREGTLRKAELIGGELRDLDMYSLLREDREEDS